MKQKMSLRQKIDLTRDGTAEMTRWCIIIALHQGFGVGSERLRKHEPLRKAEAWMHSQMPEGTVWELHIPMAKGRARSHKEWKMQGAVDSAATLEWRVCAIACAEVLGFGAERLNRLHEEVLANYRQLNQWVLEEGVDVAMEWFRRSCTSAYKTDVEVLDRPDQKEIWGYRMHEEQAMREMRTRQVRNEVRRMCAPKALPLAPAEVEKRIQTALQYGTPDSWQRRRTR